MIKPIEILTHTFRAIWPTPIAPPPVDARFNESVARFDRVLDEREAKQANPVESIIDGMFDR